MQSQTISSDTPSNVATRFCDSENVSRISSVALLVGKD